MSVVDPRPAAAQRTAARKYGPARLVATWLVAVPLLAFFSFSVVAGAATFGGKPPVAAALPRLPAGTKVVVQMPAPASDGGILERLTHAAKLVCSVNATQLAAIQQGYRTTTTTFAVGQRTIQVVSVFGASEQAIRGYVGDRTCVLVQVARVFFLPFDAHTS